LTDWVVNAASSKFMPFAIALLGRSKEELIAVVEAMVEEGGRPALLALMRELDAGAADLDALLELANPSRFRLSSAVANVYPEGPQTRLEARDKVPLASVLGCLGHNPMTWAAAPFSFAPL
jgi:hypothetical protein